MNILSTYLPGLFRIASNGALNLTTRGILYAALIASIGTLYGYHKAKGWWSDYKEDQVIVQQVKVERKAGNLRQSSTEKQVKREKKNIEFKEAIKNDPVQDTVHPDFVR